MVLRRNFRREGRLQSFQHRDTTAYPFAKVVLSPDQRFRMLYLIPCRNGKIVNAVAHHVDDRDQDEHGVLVHFMSHLHVE